MHRVAELALILEHGFQPVEIAPGAVLDQRAPEGNNPCLGSSGAIAGVTTAYLVLFPRSEVTVLYWLWLYFGTLHIRALWLIGLKIILWDNIISPQLSVATGMDPVAYSAHIAGYIFGFVTCCLMLLIRALPRDQYDIVALIRRYRQRQEFRAALADPNAQARAMLGSVAQPAEMYEARPVRAMPMVIDEITRLRGEISELLAARDYGAAADRYETLVSKDPNQILPRANMLLMANYLMTLGRYPQAAAAYEKFLNAYPTGADAGQIKLVLGIIYAKYLHQYEAAQKYLRECESRLSDPEQAQQASHWLAEAAAALGQRPSAT